MRMTFLFFFWILWEGPNSWLMLAYIGQKKKKKVVLQDNTAQHRREVSNQTTALIFRDTEIQQFLEVFLKSRAPVPKKTSLVANFPSQTK